MTMGMTMGMNMTVDINVRVCVTFIVFADMFVPHRALAMLHASLK